MVGLDFQRLSKTIEYLLRHPDPTGLVADEEGWFCLDEVANVVGRTIRRAVCAEDVSFASTRFGNARVQVQGVRMRVSASAQGERGGGPELLFHASPRVRVAEYQTHGAIGSGNGVGIHLSRSETAAWRVGHRSFLDPVVLIVDAVRARRDGVHFVRAREGLYTATEVPIRHVLNLREGFAEQASAGGFVVEWSTGAPRIALIRVTRRHGATWEVAKGKLEPGESPAVAAVREVQEEMGFAADVTEVRQVGAVRYGFYTREGSPRIKTISIFVMEVAGPGCGFQPAAAEGIEEARWFEISEALSVLSHPSLRATLGRLMQALDQRAAELGLAPIAMRRAGAGPSDGQADVLEEEGAGGS